MFVANILVLVFYWIWVVKPSFLFLVLFHFLSLISKLALSAYWPLYCTFSQCRRSTWKCSRIP